MPSVLQLLLALREPHDEDDDVLWAPSRGLHQNVGRAAVHLRLSVCTCVWAHINVFVRRGRSQHSGPLSSKTMISIKCRCFLQTRVFSPKTPPACSQRRVAATSCCLSLRNLKPRRRMKKLDCGVVGLFVSAVTQPVTERTLFSGVVGRITNAPLCHVFQSCERAQGKAENNQAAVI